MSIGTEALKFYEECTGIKQRKSTKIVDHRTSGPKHGRAYQVMWRHKGYGVPVYKWVTADWVGQYGDLLENYNKVTFMFSLIH